MTDMFLSLLGVWRGRREEREAQLIKADILR